MHATLSTAEPEFAVCLVYQGPRQSSLKMTAATLTQSSSPLCQFSSGAFLEQNQRVPGSPLSPFYAKLARNCRSPTTNSPVAHVPEVYSGSPLLRQILKAGHKRQREQDSPCVSPAKRTRGSPRVPNSIIVVERDAKRPTSSGQQEQVVPNFTSPLTNNTKQTTTNEIDTDCQRKLPENKEGVKPLDLFTGYDIFASHEE